MTNQQYSHTHPRHWPTYRALTSTLPAPCLQYSCRHRSAARLSHHPEGDLSFTEAGGECSVSVIDIEFFRIELFANPLDQFRVFGMGGIG